MTEELQIWKPQREFKGTDLVPELRPGGDIVATDELVGRENVDPDDMILPALLLLQGQSDPVTQQEEGAQPGKFWLTTAGEVIEPPLRVVIVHHSRSRALFPQENSPTADLKKCLARDALEGTEYGVCENCQHKRWGAENQKPACAEANNFVAWTLFGPAVLRFTKSSYKASRNFLTTWTMSQKNLWAHLAIVTVKSHMKMLRDGKNTTYYTMDIRWDQREDVPPAFKENARQFYDQIQRAHEAGRYTSDQENTDVGE